MLRLILGFIAGVATTCAYGVIGRAISLYRVGHDNGPLTSGQLLRRVGTPSAVTPANQIYAKGTSCATSADPCRYALIYGSPWTISTWTFAFDWRGNAVMRREDSSP